MTEDGRRLACAKVDQAFTELVARAGVVDAPTVHLEAAMK